MLGHCDAREGGNGRKAELISRRYYLLFRLFLYNGATFFMKLYEILLPFIILRMIVRGIERI